MDKFDKARTDKFKKGVLEHQDDWASIDVESEIKDEFLDIYNYADHDKFIEKYPQLSSEIKKNARKWWKNVVK